MQSKAGSHPLLVDSVVAEEACGAGGEELSPLHQNLPPRLPAPPTLGPPGLVKSPVTGLSFAALLRNLEAVLIVTCCRSQDPLPRTSITSTYFYIILKKTHPPIAPYTPKPNPCNKSGLKHKTNG